MSNGGGTGTFIILLLPLLLLAFLVFSNSRRRKQMQQFQDSIQVGDQIITTAGVYGTVVALDAATAQVRIAEGVVITLDRRAVGMRAAERPAPGLLSTLIPHTT